MQNSAVCYIWVPRCWSPSTDSVRLSSTWAAGTNSSCNPKGIPMARLWSALSSSYSSERNVQDSPEPSRFCAQPQWHSTHPSPPGRISVASYPGRKQRLCRHQHPLWVPYSQPQLTPGTLPLTSSQPWLPQHSDICPFPARNIRPFLLPPPLPSDLLSAPPPQLSGFPAGSELCEDRASICLALTEAALLSGDSGKIILYQQHFWVMGRLTTRGPCFCALMCHCCGCLSLVSGSHLSLETFTDCPI